jgi:hypothetical protein
MATLVPRILPISRSLRSAAESGTAMNLRTSRSLRPAAQSGTAMDLRTSRTLIVPDALAPALAPAQPTKSFWTKRAVTIAISISVVVLAAAYITYNSFFGGAGNDAGGV